MYGASKARYPFRALPVLPIPLAAERTCSKDPFGFARSTGSAVLGRASSCAFTPSMRRGGAVNLGPCAGTSGSDPKPGLVPTAAPDTCVPVVTNPGEHAAP